MPSFFDAAARAALIARIDRLQPDSPRQWGKMTPAQMQVHIGDQLRIALGTLPCASIANFVSTSAPVRWIVIHSPLPWPKGAPTAPELKNPATATWDADRDGLIEVIRKAAACGTSHNWQPHPAFGKLDGHSWGVLIWRHMDHHLRQFGI